MIERLVNVFVYINESYIDSIGYCEYQKEGNYEEQIDFLKSRVYEDYKIASVLPLEQPIKQEVYHLIQRLGGEIFSIIDHGIVEEGDIYCVTVIVNGNSILDDIEEANVHDGLSDYLFEYMTPEGFNFAQLIKDDYFSAIKILWNNNKYVSTMKLLFSAIDTFGFIEYGPENNSFTHWLDEYCDLDSIGVTSQEIWELRNSLLHMTNLDSRKVRNNSVLRLMPSISHPETTLPIDKNAKRFHVSRFILVILPQALEKWLKTYSKNTYKIAQFVDRYDSVVSDARLAKCPIE